MAGRLGPHEGREFELMMAGEKKLAFFSYTSRDDPEDFVPSEFEELARQGRLARIEYVTDIKDTPFRAHALFFTPPGEEWRARIFRLMSELFGRKDLPVPLSFEDLAQLEGLLLGYDRADVDYFIENWHRGRPVP